MNEQKNEEYAVEEKPSVRKQMSRRQFLNYTLGGTGSFMLSLPLLFNLRFAVDPLLQEDESSDWIKVAKVEDITETPQAFDFKRVVIDGWYKDNPRMEAWITRDTDGTIFALSPICKHLGCTVGWESSSQHPNEYFCQCHGAHYTKQGKNLAVAPEPLDEYEVKEDNGYVYLGNVVPNRRV